MKSISTVAATAAILTLCHGTWLRAGIIAYDVPGGTVGNQNFGNSLGMDFNVNDASGVTITDVGVFDDGSNGINGPLNVAIYDRRTGTIVPGSSAVLNGSDGTANGGHRFASLAAPLNLPGGFQGSIVAYGYNAAELNGNGGTLSTTAGGGSIDFVGGSRWGNDTGFPTNVDSGPENRYLAGSFIFDVIPDVAGTVNALSVPSGTVGTQAFGEPLAVDFIVTTPITVSSLGAFDSAGDGFIGTITTELWSRSGDTGIAILASDTFSLLDGSLEGGHRFKDLQGNVILAPGEYSIVSHGYSADDLMGNTGGEINQWDNQNLAIDFIGSSRFGDPGTAGSFPTNLDGNSAQYVAGSFGYTVIPEPGSISLLALIATFVALRRRRK